LAETVGSAAAVLTEAEQTAATNAASSARMARAVRELGLISYSPSVSARHP